MFIERVARDGPWQVLPLHVSDTGLVVQVEQI